MRTPTLDDLARAIDQSDLHDLLDVADKLDDDPALNGLRERMREVAAIELKRRTKIAQLEFDLRAAGREAELVPECAGPPRWFIRDYAQWLRAGGGRPVNAVCSESASCACGGQGPAWCRFAV